MRSRTEGSGQRPAASGQGPEASVQAFRGTGIRDLVSLLRTGLCALASLLLLAEPAHAQRGGRFPRGMEFMGALGDDNSYFTPPDFNGNPKYDGRFIFARIKYRGFGRYSFREGPGWSHDYPRADSHFMRIMGTITSMHPFIEEGPILGSTILGFDDAELFKYPVAYLSEPVAWHPTNSEVLGLRKYLEKGGFVIFDDFRIDSRDEDMANFVQTMAKVLPQYKVLPLPPSHPIFDSFFRIDFNQLRSGRLSNNGEFYAVFRDNDPTKRIMAVINFNQDIGDYWQWSDRGFNVVPTNEAYKLGVNYMIYALTH